MRKGKAIVAERAVFIRKFQRIFKRALIEQIKPILEIQDFTGYEQRIDNLIRKEPIELTMIKAYQEAGLYFIKRTRSTIKNGGPDLFTKADEDVWMAEMLGYVRTKVGNRITWISEETGMIVKRTIRQALEDGMSEGFGISELTSRVSQAISSTYGDIARWRSMRIAATEILTASNYGSMRGAESLGLSMTKSWLISGVNTRDTHVIAMTENQQIPMDQPFVVSGIPCEMPGDPVLPAAEVVNCGCFVIYEPIR